MKKQNNRQEYNTSYQLKLPVEISTIIEISVDKSMIGNTFLKKIR